jgi:predicted transcriptional regulator
MRDSTHSDRLDVRVHPELKARLVELARSRRMTAAEAARDAVRFYLSGASA